MSIRLSRATKQLKKCLSEYFLRTTQNAIDYPSITKVVMSKDLKNAKVYIYIRDSLADTELECKRFIQETYRINQYLSENIQLRVIPKLKFIPDIDQKKIDDLKKLLENL